MSNNAVSYAYAKSIFQLGKDKNCDVVSEFTNLQEAINSSNDLETLLFMDVFTVEEKMDVVKSILTKLSLSDLTKNVLNFLLTEKRINLFPLIYKDLIVIDDNEKGFLRGTVRGSDESLSKEDENLLVQFIKGQLGKEIVLEYQNDKRVTAGYRVEIGDYQLDATLDNQLNKLKEEIINF